MDAEPTPVSCVLLAERTWGSVLHAARSIHELGIPVHVLALEGGARVYGASRFVDSATDLQATAHLDDRVRAHLEWVASGHLAAVLPTSDRGVALLDRIRTDLDSRILPMVASPDVVANLLRKDRAAEIAGSAGLHVLPWCVVGEGSEQQGLDTLDLPVIIRPIRWDTGGAKAFKLRIARDRATLDHLLDETVGSGATVIVQNYLATDVTAVEFALCWTSEDGSRTELVTGRKRRQASADGGVMVWGESAPLPDVATAARTFVAESGHRGLGGLEVIRDDGKLWFVEWNPRLEAIHFLATASGVDLVGLAAAEQLGIEGPAVESQKVAAAWLGGPFLEQLRDPRGRRTALADRIAFGRAPNRIRSLWSLRDPGPTFEVVKLLVSALSRLVRSSLT